MAIPRVTPGSDDFQVRRQRGGGEFESHLVIALTRRAVCDGVGLFLLRDFHHAFGNQRPGDARAEKVLAFVNRARVNHRIDEVAREFLLEVVHVNL